MTTDSQPTPEQVAHDVMRALDGAKHHDIDTTDVGAILGALPRAGYAVVKLPTGTERPHVAYGDKKMVVDYLGWKRSQITVEPEGMIERGVPYTGPYLVQYMNGGAGVNYTPESARQYAAALLAAADAAERGVR